MSKYRINEIFCSPQGEGSRAGELSTFVRFSGCNLSCARDTDIGGFDCDTEFVSGRTLDSAELLEAIKAHPAKWVVWTGGEPSLQLTQTLVDAVTAEGYKQAIETNGTKEVPNGLDFVCVSPKTAEHTLRIDVIADEVRYVRHVGQGIPKPSIRSIYKYLSPAFSPERGYKENLEWCLKLQQENPEWRISVQQHKLWGVR